MVPRKLHVLHFSGRVSKMKASQEIEGRTPESLAPEAVEVQGWKGSAWPMIPTMQSCVYMIM